MAGYTDVSPREIEDAKRDHPDVKIRYCDTIYVGRVSNSDGNFALVTIWPKPGLYRDAEFSWVAIARAVKENRCLVM